MKPKTNQTSRWVLCLALICASTAHASETVPIQIKEPAACNFVQERPGTWVCDYIAKNARSRAVILDYHKITLDAQGRETVASLDAETLELVLSDEIRKIDKRRENALPPGEYLKLHYEMLGVGDRPAGFVSCAKSFDQMVLEGEDIRTDRASLHCWAVERDQGVVFQLLLSLMEYGSADESYTPSLLEEFSDIVLSIRRR